VQADAAEFLAVLVTIGTAAARTLLRRLAVAVITG
jgi:hypothetical protein